LDAVGQFIEDRVLHAREDAEENARAERLADPDAYTTEPRGSCVSDEDLLTLNPWLRRLARDDVVLEPLAFSGPPLLETRAGGFVIDCAGHTPLMTSRDERMARNEAASREINEEIEEAYQGEPPANRLDIVCECALKMCDRSIDITMAEYRMVRSDLRQFAIVPEHLAADIERKVYETDRFAVVAKRERTPADVARDENQQG